MKIVAEEVGVEGIGMLCKRITALPLMGYLKSPLTHLLLMITQYYWHLEVAFVETSGVLVFIYHI